MRFKKNKFDTLAKKQQGAVAIMFAILLIPIIGFAALAVDVGYLYVVRNELQNAADTAALAGANAIYPPVGSSPNFALANTKAMNAVALNKAANITLAPDTDTLHIKGGYWNMASNSSSWKDLPLNNPGSNDFPAVKVTISKANGNSNSAVNTFFAKVFGMNLLDVSATAVAVVVNPGSTKKALFPIAISKCMYDTYWDSSSNQPTDVGATGFAIGSVYHSGACEAGQWTSLNLDTNNVPDVRNLIDYASGAQTNPSPPSPPLGIDSNIWIQPGTKTTLYSSVDACSARGDSSCAYMVVPVVCANAPACDRIDTHTSTPIVGLACIHILQADGGSTKTITVKMVAPGNPACKLPGSLAGGVGATYGLYIPPKLVNYWGNSY